MVLLVNIIGYTKILTKHNLGEVTEGNETLFQHEQLKHLLKPGIHISYPVHIILIYLPLHMNVLLQPLNNLLSRLFFIYIVVGWAIL